MISPSRGAGGSTRNILVVDDDDDFLRYIQTLLETDHYQVETASSGLVALNRIVVNPLPDLVLLDVRMPELDGLETLRRLQRVRPSVKVVMLSCETEPHSVVEAMRLGARDYLGKPFEKDQLDNILGQYVRVPSSSEANFTTNQVFEELSENLYFAASSAAMRTVYAQIRQVASANVPVFLLGESGTGKEVAARLIHKLSPRPEQPFLKVNCAALPADLLESELFGYEPGAFTGAVRPKPGKFELARGGTILLDEIGEIPPTLQAKLLHVLQDHEFSRLGGSRTVRVDVRVLAATNVNIRQALQSGRLREDLFYRLNTIAITLPPLRERREEIPFLLRHFMTLASRQYGREPMPFSPQLVDACMNHSWPGNLRELECFVKRYLILGDEDLVIGELYEDLQPSVAPVGLSLRPYEDADHDLKGILRNMKRQVEMEAIVNALAKSWGNRSKAARLLKISYRALLYKIREFGIDLPSSENGRVGMKPPGEY